VQPVAFDLGDDASTLNIGGQRGGARISRGLITAWPRRTIAWNIDGPGHNSRDVEAL
jgi:hypothetical protein